MERVCLGLLYCDPKSDCKPKAYKLSHIHIRILCKLKTKRFGKRRAKRSARGKGGGADKGAYPAQGDCLRERSLSSPATAHHTTAHVVTLSPRTDASAGAGVNASHAAATSLRLGDEGSGNALWEKLRNGEAFTDALLWGVRYTEKNMEAAHRCKKARHGRSPPATGRPIPAHCHPKPQKQKPVKRTPNAYLSFAILRRPHRRSPAVIILCIDLRTTFH